MSGFVVRQSKKAGLPPGTLMHTGALKSESTVITVMDYDEAGLNEKLVENINECGMPADDTKVRWINVDGLHRIDMFEKLGELYGLHPLVMEDILNTSQRPKLEDYGNYIYIVMKMLYTEGDTGDIIAEQQSLVLGKNFVLSVGEKKGDVFELIRERIRNGAGRIRKMGPDYLVYSILDSIVDNYFIVLDKLGDSIESLEEVLTGRPTQDTLQMIHRLKRNMLYMHKAIWPLREVAGALERGESQLITEPTQVYMRDVYDHVVQAMDTAETFRDMLSGMLDIYLSSISNRMNEVMKVLTVISTLFIPLTFIAGIYGMNFKYMPELGLRWGYYAVLGLMCVIAVLMLAYFKKKKWF